MPTCWHTRPPRWAASLHFRTVTTCSPTKVLQGTFSRTLASPQRLLDSELPAGWASDTAFSLRRLVKPLRRALLPECSKLFKSHRSNQWFTSRVELSRSRQGTRLGEYHDENRP